MEEELELKKHIHDRYEYEYAEVDLDYLGWRYANPERAKVVVLDEYFFDLRPRNPKFFPGERRIISPRAYVLHH